MKKNQTNVNYIHIPYLNTGSVADIDLSKKRENRNLDKILKKLNKSLNNSREKFKMDEYFAKQL